MKHHTSILLLLLFLYCPVQAEPRIQPQDLKYIGAFRLPDGPEEYAWLWSGQALAYNPGGNAKRQAQELPGSLFGVGHDWHQYVSEISIPKPIISRNLEALPTARTLQKFANIKQGLYEPLEQARSGLAYLPAQGSQTSAKLYFCWDSHMHEGHSGPSHGWCETNLSTPRSSGPWAIEGLTTYLTSDYLFPLSQEWAQRHTGGKRLVTGRFRDGGQGSLGPALFAIAPWQHGIPPKAGTNLKATTLLRYSSVYDDKQVKLKNYHHSDEWSGAAFLGPSFIFVGTKGKGKCWYGFANGVVWPEGGPYPPVPDYPNDERGWWSTDFSAQILFYDAADLAAVAQSKIPTSKPQPYAVMTIDDVLYRDTKRRLRRVGACAYDHGGKRLYVLEHRGDGDKSVVHCWKAQK